MVSKKFITESPAEPVTTVSSKTAKEAGNEPVKKESFTTEQILSNYNACPDDEWWGFEAPAYPIRQFDFRWDKLVTENPPHTLAKFVFVCFSDSIGSRLTFDPKKISVETNKDIW